jgi:pimeloyl-ACP methyl ester carboxylesterase
VRLYAAAHPDDVVGLVLVDAVHERELTAIRPLLSPAQRAAGAKMRPLSPEGIDIDKVMGQLAKARMPPKLPLVVVARGRPLAKNEMPADWTTDQRQRREQLRRALQQELSRLSEMGTLVVAEKSGHFVHHDEPALVVAAIRALVLSAR